MSKNSIHDRLGAVIDGGYCIGCGTCAGIDRRLKMVVNEDGMFEARREADYHPTTSAADACPFADGVPNEDELGKELYGAFAKHNSMTGYYLKTYAGWVTEQNFRDEGSSGGMGSWILSELLRRDMVDRVVHVVANREAAGGELLFQFGISETEDDIRKNPKSRYYPVEMSEVIQHMVAEPGRYAVVGIPCFLKSLRLAARSNPILAERISYTVGLVCGHLKSSGFAQLLAWQCGIKPDELKGIDFRRKIPGARASHYGITVSGECAGETVEKEAAVHELYGRDWGHGFFKYKACEFCDDVLAELADITVGDAWLPEYAQDAEGTNVVVVRRPELVDMCQVAATEGRLKLDDLSIDRTILSQAGGFRHRREGLSYRLWREEQAGRWHPPKRVPMSEDHLDRKQKELFEARFELMQESHRAFRAAKQRGDLEVFMKQMKPLTDAYQRRFYRKSLLRRFKIRVRKWLDPIYQMRSKILKIPTK